MPDWADQLSLRLVPHELRELAQLPQFRPRPRAAAPEDYQQARAQIEYPVLLAVITRAVKTQLENYSRQVAHALDPFLFGEDSGANASHRA